jgi:hypothetical protein
MRIRGASCEKIASMPKYVNWCIYLNIYIFIMMEKNKKKINPTRKYYKSFKNIQIVKWYGAHDNYYDLT